MFTGIVEATGLIRALRHGSAGAAMEVSAPGIADGLKVGDSIAVNGVCLTVVECGEGLFSCDLSPETLARTSFGRVREGTPVNLEQPLAVGSRLGGHFVQGHVDGIGTVADTTPAGEGAVMTIEYPPALERYLVSKGSVAVHGVSLTVATILGYSFTVAVIPHTLNRTNLGRMRPRDPVNLEVDILAKYFERFFQLGLGQDRSDKWDLEYLKEQGF